MRLKLIISLGCFLGITLILSALLSAQMVIGKLQGEGVVYIEKNGRWEKVVLEYPIFIGDRIKVEEGCIHALFENDASLVLHPKIIIKILNFNSTELKIKIEKGNLDFKLSSDIKGKFLTPTCKVTTFIQYVTTTDDYNIGAIDVIKPSFTRVCCFRGVLYIKDFSDKIVLTLNAQENTNVKKKENIVVAKLTNEKCRKCGAFGLFPIITGVGGVATAVITIVYYEESKEPASAYRLRRK